LRVKSSSTFDARNKSLSNSLSGARHLDVAASVSWRQVDLSKARRLAVARPKLRGRRSSSTVLSHAGLPRSTGSALPVFGRMPNAGVKRSRMVLTGVGTAKVAKERQAPSTDRFSIWQEWLTPTRPNHVTGEWRQNPSSEHGECVWGTNYPIILPTSAFRDLNVSF